MAILFVMKLLKIFTIIILLGIISTTASAITYHLGYGTETIEITIPTNQDAAYVIPLRVGDKLTVDLEVVEGGSVDFYLSNETAYELYLAGVAGTIHFDSLYYVEEYSRTSVGNIHYTYDSLVKNNLVVIVDNAGYVGGAPEGEVTVEGTIVVQKNVWTLQNIIITVVLIILIIIFMLSFRYPRKKAK